MVELLNSTRPYTNENICINAESLVSWRIGITTPSCSSTCSQGSGVRNMQLAETCWTRAARVAHRISCSELLLLLDDDDWGRPPGASL